MSVSYPSLITAMAVATSLSMPSALLAQSAQDHTVHHPDGQATGSTPTQPQVSGAPGAAVGAAPTVRPGAPSSGNMMGGNMMQMMQMMHSMRGMMDADGMPGMGRMGPAALQHIEGQIAFYKAELHVTDAQAPQWNAFADALRASTKQLQAAYGDLLQSKTQAAAPDQLARRADLLSAQLNAVNATEPTARALYAVLSDEQKKTADELMADHLRRM